MTRPIPFKPLRQTLPALWVAFCLMVGLALAGCHRGLPPFSTGQPDERKVALDVYHEAWSLVFADYVDPTYNGQDWYRWRTRYDKRIHTLDDAYAAMRTMLASLDDPYTRFLNPHNAQDQNMHIDSHVSGVGVQIAGKDNQIVVITAMDGSPAKRAGIQPLDRIVMVNAKPVANMTMDDVVDNIRGPRGEAVQLTVARGGRRIVFHLIRQDIPIKTVFGDPISKDIGYIRLSSFISQDASEEMRQKLLQQVHTRAMIVDLRGNTGGLLQNALDISDMFLKSGDIVSVVDRNRQRQVFQARASTLYDQPLVLLIDGGSASASEIMSGALKDNHRATLIGETTFGKGLVQKINYLEDGSELNLTTSRYLTPAGHDINLKGISPDIVVPFVEADFLHHRDPQKDAAIRYLKSRFSLAHAS